MFTAKLLRFKVMSFVLCSNDEFRKKKFWLAATNIK